MNQIYSISSPQDEDPRRDEGRRWRQVPHSYDGAGVFDVYCLLVFLKRFVCDACIDFNVSRLSCLKTAVVCLFCSVNAELIFNHRF